MLDFWNKVKTYVTEFFALVAVIFFGMFWVEKKKEETQEALKTNAETLGKVEQINTQISNLQKDEKEKESETSQKDLTDFLDKPNPNK